MGLAGTLKKGIPNLQIILCCGSFAILAGSQPSLPIRGVAGK